MKFSDFLRINTRKLATFLGLALSLFAFFALLTFPEETSLAAKNAVAVCLESLIPSLFPFFVLSNLAVSCGFSKVVSKVFSRLMPFIFGTSPETAVPFVLGFLSGFPVGAASASELYLKGEISKTDAEKALCFSNFPSVGFIVSAVGVGVFESSEVGWALFATVTFLGLVSAVAVCRAYRKKGGFHKVECASAESRSLLETFLSAVTSSGKSVLSVSAFVLFFSVVCGVFVSVFSLPYPISSLFSGFFEISSGAASLVPELSAENLALAAAILSWSGLSVHFQVASRLAERLSVKPYLLSKTLSALLSAVFALAVFPFLTF